MESELQELTKNEQTALTWPEKAKALAIVDNAGYTAAANMKKDLLVLRKGIIEDNEEQVRTALAAHRSAVARRDRYLKPIEEAEGILKTGIRKYEDEQERLRRIEQQRLEAEAREAAEADRQRREAEAKAIRDAELAVQAEARKREEDERLAVAEAARAAGATAEAVDAILDTPVMDIPEVAPLSAYIEPAPYQAPVVAAPTYARVTGTGIRRTWKGRVTNFRELCRAIGAGEVAENLAEPNQTAINGRARSDQSMMKIPGVIAYED